MDYVNEHGGGEEGLKENLLKTGRRLMVNRL